MNPHYQTFIIEMIKHGDKERAYHKTYPKAKGESAIKGAERLLRNPQIAAEIREAVSAIHADAYAKACKVHAELKEVKILSIMKKREILNQLATCEMKVGRYVKGQYDYVMVYEDPRPRDIIRAIELDTKLEEMLNNARNIEDIKLSRFDIYIDGRPCDDPTAEINPHIPQGLVMLPRKKKNIPELIGNKKEQNSETNSPFEGPSEWPARAEGVSHRLTGDVDSHRKLANEISPDFIGNKKEHPDSYRDKIEEVPLLFLGGDIGEALSAPEPIGEVDSRLTIANKISPDSTGNKKEQNSETNSPFEGGVSHRLTGDVDSHRKLANEISPDFTGNKMEHPRENALTTIAPSPWERAGGEASLVPEALTLKTQVLHQKQQLRDKDPMHGSFYKDFVRRREQAPAPRVYTDGEIQAIKETGSPVLPSIALEAINIPKSGKLIFTEKKYMDDGL